MTLDLSATASQVLAVALGAGVAGSAVVATGRRIAGSKISGRPVFLGMGLVFVPVCWGIVETVLPWCSSQEHFARLASPVLLAAMAGFVFLGLAGAGALYLASILDESSPSSDPPSARSGSGVSDGRGGSGQAEPEAPAPLPVLRPAPGVVPAALDTGSGPEVERLALFRLLETGPDFQRLAAAKALALAFSGERDLRVARALLDVIARGDCSDASRAEACIALHEVMEQALPWDQEVQLRHSFPGGLDQDFIDACEARVVRELES